MTFLEIAEFIGKHYSNAKVSTSIPPNVMGTSYIDISIGRKGYCVAFRPGKKIALHLELTDGMGTRIPDYQFDSVDFLLDWLSSNLPSAK